MPVNCQRNSVKKDISLFQDWRGVLIPRPMKQHPVDGLRRLLREALIISTRQKMQSFKDSSAKMVCC